MERSESIAVLNVVALLADAPEYGLVRGQVGTVVVQLAEEASASSDAPAAVGHGFTPRQAGREGPPYAPEVERTNPSLEELEGWLAAIRAART